MVYESSRLNPNNEESETYGGRSFYPQKYMWQILAMTTIKVRSIKRYAWMHPYRASVDGDPIPWLHQLRLVAPWWHQTIGISRGGKHQPSTVLLRSNQSPGHSGKISTATWKKFSFRLEGNISSFWRGSLIFRCQSLVSAISLPGLHESCLETSHPIHLRKKMKKNIFYQSSDFSVKCDNLSQILDAFLLSHLLPPWCPKLTLSSLPQKKTSFKPWTCNNPSTFWQKRTPTFWESPGKKLMFKILDTNQSLQK